VATLVFKVTGSNAGDYTVSAGGSSHAGGTTTIPVDEAVASAVVDGDVYNNRIDVALGKGFRKTADTEIGATVSFDWTAVTNLELTNNATNKVCLDTDKAVKVTTGALTHTTQFSIGKVYRGDTTLHIVSGGTRVYNLARRGHFRARELREWERASGLVTSESANLKLKVTAGVMYAGYNRVTTSEVDTNAGGTFTYYYKLNGVWKKITDQTDIHNTQYNDVSTPGSEVFGTLGTGRYGVHWVYIDHDGHLFVQYGQGSYKLAEAQEALVPDAPTFLDDFAILVARIIIKKSDPSILTSGSIDSAFEIPFMPSTTIEHNDLAALDTGDYQHLTAAEDAAKILSNPQSGQYRITGLRLSAAKHIIVTYDENAEP